MKTYYKYNPVLLKTPSYWEQSCFLQIIYLLNGKKGKEIFEISFKCNKIYFYEFFDAKFRLEETRELPLYLGNGWS